MEWLAERLAPDNRSIEPPAEPTPEEICVILARELRSPLSTIEGFLDLLAQESMGPLTDAQRNVLDVVSRNVHRLTAVVGDWHEMARVEAGQLEHASTPVDLGAMVDRAVATWRPRIRAKKQHLAVDVPVVPAIALGDPRALLRVVDNLLSNAHKYTPPGGTIRVVLGAGDDWTVRLDVVDSGIGIRDEDQPLLFRRYFRARLTDSEPGAGVGLTLVRALVERMGGQIAVRSVFGKGSTFSVVLPRGAEPSDWATGEPMTPVSACHPAR